MRKIAVPLWMLLFGFATWTGFLNTPIVGDVRLFIPKPETRSERFFLTEIGQGPAARIILMAVEGGTGEERAEVSKAFAAALRESGHFVRVENGAPSQLAKDIDLLFPYRYLLSPEIAAGRFEAPSLRRTLDMRLAELASPVAPFPKQWLPRDPTGEFLAYLKAGRPVRQPARHLGVWFSPDRRRALLMAETRASPLEVFEQARVFSDTQEAFQRIAGERGMTLRLSGPGFFAVMSRDAIHREVMLLSILAAVMVVAIFLFLFRSPLLLVLGGLPLVSAVVAGWGAVGIFYPGIHGITLAFGVILVGATIDFPLHFFSQLRKGEDPWRTMARIWPTLRLSWITTCLAFSAMVFTDFTGLVQIGIFAAVGLMSAGLVTGWVLPALLPASWRPRFHLPAFSWVAALLRIPRWAGPTAFGVTAILLLAVFVSKPLRWEVRLASMSPIPQELLELDRTLRSQIGAPDINHIVLVAAPDAQAALETSEVLAEKLSGLVEEGKIAGFDMAALYLPSHRTQKKRRLLLPDGEKLSAALAEASRGLPFRPDLFEPFQREVEASRKLPPLGPLAMAGTAMGLRVGSLLFPVESGWLALVPLSGGGDPAELAEELAAMREDGVHYLHLGSANREMMERFRDETLLRVSLGALVMLLVLLVGLRPRKRLAGVLLPVGMASLVVLAILMLLEQPLNLFHLFSLLLTFGIGIDYCLFFGKLETDSDSRIRTTHGLIVCLLSTVLMFGTLALSQVLILKVIGSTVALGVALCFFFALIFARPSPNLSANEAAQDN